MLKNYRFNKQWFKHQWHKLVFSVFILSLVLFLWFSGFLQRSNYVLYDTFVGLTQRPASPQILLINIDDKSLGSLGRWPWSRQIHAEMLDILTESGVKRIGFDILFSAEELNNNADQRFADSIAKSTQVVLAISPQSDYNGQGIGELLPLPKFAKQAAALAHVDFELDSDGRCRSVYLAAGLGSPHWPAFGLALASSVAELNNKVGSENELDLKSEYDGAQTILPSRAWVRKQHYLIPFVGPPESFRSLSYIDVLNHKVDRQKLKDKIVLIGVTASGLGDVIATPSSTEHKLMSGLELNANVVAGLLDNKYLAELASEIQLALAIGVLLIFYHLLNFFSRKKAPTIFISALLMTMAGSVALFIYFSIWFPPLLLLIGLCLIYLFWDWFELENTSLTIHSLRRQIFYQTRHDEVTALPNRTRLQELIQVAIQSNCSQCALLVVNLGRFKMMNDRLGYKAGDLALNMAAARIQNALKQENCIARLSGGEFAVFIEKLQDESALSHAGALILQALQISFNLNNKEFYLQPSIGIASYPRDGSNAESLFNNALTAMHQAKRDNKRGLYFFSFHLKDDLFNQLDLEQDLHHALLNHEFAVHYQPQVEANNGQIVGFEALLRWHHPQRGLIPPSDFIPLAEYTGDIIDIGYWVLESACRQGNSLIKKGLPNVRMAVNLSPVQFAQKDLLENVAAILEQTEFPTQQLELELTESTLMDDMDAATQTLKLLKELGVQLSVDDFGTGYSSLNYLRRFPMDRIKIDKSFVDELDADAANAEITTAIIDMAHRLDMDVIAEGVESSAQQEFLRSQHCEELQGFYFSRPLPAEKLDELIAISQANSGEKPLSALTNPQTQKKS